MLENDHYTYRVTWSEEDNEYVGLCAEFPSLSWLDQTPEDALIGIRQVVADVVKDLSGTGEIVPEPLATKKYSGKFQVRVTADTHRALAIKAAEKKVSLNRLVSESFGSCLLKRKNRKNEIWEIEPRLNLGRDFSCLE